MATNPEVELKRIKAVQRVTEDDLLRCAAQPDPDAAYADLVRNLEACEAYGDAFPNGMFPELDGIDTPCACDARDCPECGPRLYGPLADGLVRFDGEVYRVHRIRREPMRARLELIEETE